MPAHPSGPDQGAFWTVFERSQIPMALVDGDRRYVAVNDALLDLYQYRREDIIGSRAGTGMPDEDPEQGEREWQGLVRTGELYGERVVRRTADDPVRVNYAAHVTNLNGRWLAVFVVLSAQSEPDGRDLIAAIEPDAPRQPRPPARPPERSQATVGGRTLTQREREIVHLVSLGRSTPQIATELGLSPATVRSHVRNAMVKTGAHTRAQLVALLLGERLANN